MEQKILSAENLLELGILDEVYDLYKKVYSIADIIKESSRENIIEEIRICCRKDVSDFLDRNIYLLSGKYKHVHINNEMMKNFYILKFKKDKACNYSPTIISFSKFINMLQQFIGVVILKKELKARPKISIEVVERELKKRIKSLIEGKKALIEDIVNAPPLNIIWVYRNTTSMKCIKDDHQTEYCLMSVKSLDYVDYITISVRYCHSCKKYFISEQSLKAFEQKYGIMLVRKHEERSINGNDDFYSTFCNESDLHSRGYNVKADGLTDAVRKKFILRLIKEKMMSADAIHRDIENALRIFSSNAKFVEACKKWNDDLVFVDQITSFRFAGTGELKNIH